MVSHVEECDDAMLTIVIILAIALLCLILLHQLSIKRHTPETVLFRRISYFAVCVILSSDLGKPP